MDGKRLRFSFWYVLLAFWAVLLLQQAFTSYLRPTRMAYSDFKVAVAAGKVAEVSISETTIEGKLKPQAAGVTPATPPPAGRRRRPRFPARGRAG